MIFNGEASWPICCYMQSKKEGILFAAENKRRILAIWYKVCILGKCLAILIMSVSLVALDVFFLGITSCCKRWGSLCAGCKQKHREAERFAVVCVCWVAMVSSSYQPAAPLGGLFLSIFLHGFRSSHEQWWTDNLHDNVSRNKSIQETSQESEDFIITYTKIV